MVNTQKLSQKLNKNVEEKAESIHKAGKGGMYTAHLPTLYTHTPMQLIPELQFISAYQEYRVLLCLVGMKADIAFLRIQLYHSSVIREVAEIKQEEN